MTHIETGELTTDQLLNAIECHLAEAHMHLMTAKTLLELATEQSVEA